MRRPHARSTRRRPAPFRPPPHAPRAATPQRPLADALESRRLLTVVNGSFEQFLHGWEFNPAGGGIEFVNAHYSQVEQLYVPDRNYMARLASGGLGTATTLAQDVRAQAGDILSGYSFFESYTGWSDTRAGGYVAIKSGGETVATPFEAVDDDIYDPDGYVPWKRWEYEVPADGVYRVEAGVWNDAGWRSYLGLDAVGLNDQFPPRDPMNNPPPVADAGGPYEIDEGESLQLVGSGYDPFGDTLTYYWDLDSDGADDIYYEQSPLVSPGMLHNYGMALGPRTQTITLHLHDAKGNVGTATTTVTVNNVAPEVSEITGPRTMKVNRGGFYSVSATDAAGEFETLTYDWTLTLDGEVVHSASGWHDFYIQPQEAGDYVVNVAVGDGAATVYRSYDVTILPNAAPTLTDFSVTPLSTSEGGFAIAKGSFTDPDAGDEHHVLLQWEAMYGDSVLGGGVGSGPNAVNPANGHRYYLFNGVTWEEGRAVAQAAGGHLVTIDDAGEQDWVWNSFSSWAPHFWIGMSDAGAEGEWGWSDGTPVGYTNWAEGQPDDAGGEDYARLNTWGGGQWVDAASERSWALVEVDPSAPGAVGPDDFVAYWRFFDDTSGQPGGAFDMTATVVDGSDARDSASVAVTVANEAPRLEVDAAVTTIQGYPLLYGNVVDAGIADAHVLTVDYGDGSRPERVDVWSNGSGRNGFWLLHDYRRAGTYTMTITAADDDGAVSARSTTAVTVINAVPEIYYVTGPEGAVTAEPLTFEAYATDPGGGPMRGTVDFGDGTVRRLHDFSGTLTLEHAYVLPGDYVVTLTVTDREGAVTSRSHGVRVETVRMVDANDGWGRSVLHVGGLAGANHFEVRPADSGGVEVFLNGMSVGVYWPGAGVVLYGHSGHDTAVVYDGTPLPVTFYGGAGNDVLFSGSATDILVGGGGRDRVFGGATLIQ